MLGLEKKYPMLHQKGIMGAANFGIFAPITVFLMDRMMITDDDVIKEELVVLEKNYNLKKLDKIFLVIIKAAIFEFLYKSKTPMKIIIKEYLDASNFFLDSSQIKYLHSIIDKLGKNIRKNYE